MRWLGCALAAILLILTCLPPAARADEIFFKNGDRLTGEILSTDDGKVKFRSPLLGEVTFKLADLESFKSQRPVSVRLKDGTTTKSAVVDGEKGQIILAPNTPAARTVPMEQVRTLNAREGWTGSLAAGANFSRGNTFTDQANATLELERRTDRDRTTAGGAYLYGRQKEPDSGDKRTTQDSWMARAKYDYFYSPQVYGYGNVKVERDNIAHLDMRLTPGVGLGYQWAEHPQFNFSSEAGLTYVYEKFDPASSPDLSSRQTKEYLGGRLAYKVEWKPTDRVTVFHSAEWLPSFQEVSDYLINTDAGLRVGLVGRMFLEYKFTLQYDALPAPGASNTDLKHLVTIGWQF